MDTLEALRLYVTIAETGSFSAAARQVSVSTSTVTVALQQLEEQARVTLITRSTRSLSFTFEGRRFLAGSVSSQRVRKFIDFLAENLVAD